MSRAACQVLARVGTACLLAAGTCATMTAGTAEAAAKLTQACPAPVVSGAIATVTCSYTGAAQSWTVPAGVLQATFTLYGAAGGPGAGPDSQTADGGAGGVGAEVTGTLAVTPGSVLRVKIGQAGTLSSGAAFGGGGSSGGGGAQGGGGGGATDIRGGAYTLADRLLVAGGGGGGGAGGVNGDTFAAAPGGAGGDAAFPGGAGAQTSGWCAELMTGGGGGLAGAISKGGTGGAGSVMTGPCAGTNGYTAGSGAAGSKGTGGSGGGGGGPAGGGGGGGGGGYYGGGGGGGQTQDEAGGVAGAGGGGGGASYTGTATGVSVNDDPASPPPGGNGEVIITYHPVLSVTDYSLAGHETAASCLTGSRCVAVGSRRSRGLVVTLAGGAQKHAAVLRGSSVIGSVSCPSTSGCWALGHRVRGAGAYLVKISSLGRMATNRMVPVPAGTSLGSISCTSMTSCEVAGTDNRVRPAAIEVGTWNGVRLHLYRVRVPGSTQVSIGGISCWQRDCEAVGAARVGSATSDVIVTTSGGKPGTLTTDTGYGLRGISCVSATTCYAAGAAVLVTVTNGKPGDPQAIPDGWKGNAIECTGSDCEAAGGEVFGAAYADVLVSLSDGTAGSPVIVQVGRGFTGIAARSSSGFIAIGAGSKSGSKDTVG